MWLFFVCLCFVYPCSNILLNVHDKYMLMFITAISKDVILHSSLRQIQVTYD